MKALLDQARILDQEDELASFSEQFVPGNYDIYLDGNSLGKLPKKTVDRIKTTVEQQWGDQLINSWNAHWLDLPKRLASDMEQLIRATKGSVYIGESTSVNLYKLVLGLVLSNRYEKNLSTDLLNFPSDNYILEGIAEQQGASYHLIHYPTYIEADLQLLKTHIASNPGIICLSMVSFKSAYYYPVKELNDWAKNHQSIIVWDMSHAVGICDVDCKKMKIRAAVGCSYKYLNGGPGAPAFLMLDHELLEGVGNPIQGWFGHQKPFEFNLEYDQEISINRFANGTPSIISMAALEIGLRVSLQAGISTIAKKNKRQIQFLIEAVKKELLALDFELICPDSMDRIGGHLSIAHPQAKAIVEVLKSGAKNHPSVLPDFRPPNLIRLGVASLYVSYEDLVQTVAFLKDIVVTKMYKNVETQNHIVP
jgi:kynureninase